eukprot:1032372-Rhodomonas_salina.1
MSSRSGDDEASILPGVSMFKELLLHNGRPFPVAVSHAVAIPERGHFRWKISRTQGSDRTPAGGVGSKDINGDMRDMPFMLPPGTVPCSYNLAASQSRAGIAAEHAGCRGSGMGARHVRAAAGSGRVRPVAATEGEDSAERRRTRRSEEAERGGDVA